MRGSLVLSRLADFGFQSREAFSDLYGEVKFTAQVAELFFNAVNFLLKARNLAVHFLRNAVNFLLKARNLGVNFLIQPSDFHLDRGELRLNLVKFRYDQILNDLFNVHCGHQDFLSMAHDSRSESHCQTRQKSRVHTSSCSRHCEAPSDVILSPEGAKDPVLRACAGRTIQTEILRPLRGLRMTVAGILRPMLGSLASQ